MESNVLILGYDGPVIGVISLVVNQVMPEAMIHVNELKSNKTPDVIIYELLPPNSFLDGSQRDDFLEIIKMEDLKKSNPNTRLIVLANHPGDAIARVVAPDCLLEKPAFTSDLAYYLEQQFQYRVQQPVRQNVV